jgi:hypothetical protein
LLGAGTVKTGQLLPYTGDQRTAGKYWFPAIQASMVLRRMGAPVAAPPCSICTADKWILKEIGCVER